MSLSEHERQESLALIEEANRRMAEKAKAPGWYHWTLGVLIGGLCAVQALPLPLVVAYYPVMLFGAWLLMRAYRRRTGIWLLGTRAGRTRWVALSSAAIGGGVFFAAIWAARTTGQPGWYLAGGLLLGAATAVRGYAWEKAYRRDLGVG